MGVKKVRSAIKLFSCSINFIYDTDILLSGHTEKISNVILYKILYHEKMVSNPSSQIEMFGSRSKVGVNNKQPLPSSDLFDQNFS